MRKDNGSTSRSGADAEVKAAAEVYERNIVVYSKVDGTWVKKNFVSSSNLMEAISSWAPLTPTIMYL